MPQDPKIPQDPLLTQLFITHICHALTAQELKVAKIQADLERLKEAETLALLLIDFDPPTGPTVAECTQRLESAQAHLRQLQGKFNNTKSYWHSKKYHLKLGQPWLRLRPSPPPPSPPTPTLENDPSVCYAARAAQETGPTINPKYLSIFPTPPQPRPLVDPRVWRKHAWWMTPENTEKVLIYTGQRIPHCPKRYARRRYLTARDQFVDEEARQKAGGENIGFRVTAGEQPDPQCDPKFWEKQLWGKGDIFQKKAGLFESRAERVEEEELAPDQMPAEVVREMEMESSSGEDSEMVDADAEFKGMYSQAYRYGPVQRVDSEWDGAAAWDGLRPASCPPHFKYGEGFKYGKQEQEEEMEWGSGGSTTSSDGELRVPNFEEW